MHDKQTAAVDRYRAMAGLIKKLPPKAARKAKADEKHVERYVTKRRGAGLSEPGRRYVGLLDDLTQRLAGIDGVLRRPPPHSDREGLECYKARADYYRELMQAGNPMTEDDLTFMRTDLDAIPAGLKSEFGKPRPAGPMGYPVNGYGRSC